MEKLGENKTIFVLKIYLKRISCLEVFETVDLRILYSVQRIV